VLLALSAGVGGQGEGGKLAQELWRVGAVLKGDSPSLPGTLVPPGGDFGGAWKGTAIAAGAACPLSPLGCFPSLIVPHICQSHGRCPGMPRNGHPWVTFCSHVPHLFPMALPCPTATLGPMESYSTPAGMGETPLPRPGHPPCPAPQREKALNPSGGDLSTGPGMGQAHVLKMQAGLSALLGAAAECF